MLVPPILWLALACAPAPLGVEISAAPGGFEVVASAPVDRVEVYDADGRPIVVRRLPAPQARVHVSAPVGPGTWRVRVRAGDAVREQEVLIHDPGAVRVEVEAPLGQPGRPLGDLPVTVVDGAPVEVGLRITAREPGLILVLVDGATRAVEVGAPGETALLRVTVGARPVELVVGGQRGRLVPRAISGEEVASRLKIAGVRFPVDPNGRRDPARPSDRVALPARWWEAGLAAFGLGWRPRDDQAPWAWQAIDLENSGPEPLDVVVRADVDDPAFRSRLREAKTARGGVTALVRVPAGGAATAVIPLFVERATVRPGTYAQRVEIRPLGASGVLREATRPLVVTRGSAAASAGFALSMAASVAGLGVLAARGRAWVAALRTSELTTIALFGSLTFVVATTSQLVGHGLAAVLGPFSPLLTGWFDDAFRTCLLATLLVLVPRPGVVALATLIGWLMRGLALGSFHPMDVLYFGSVVAWLEGCLWLGGLTRSGAWREEGRLARWARLSLGFATASMLTSATGLVLQAVLYRLFLADWYVALMVAGPGFLYVVAGCWLAVDFSAALRRVEP